jgi:hypothetical protein
MHFHVPEEEDEEERGGKLFIVYEAVRTLQ